ncbi:uncharacterized protein LOC113381613 [Ctenocephalides felis]|uniref:uncharacterized protein LOC113381613 n=1 Tax=Ctenocephalides felis TaxID=7515 RepID=UPI000E6E16F6|nr:uncharacterized protein LOC113381613 [Ctenocephalides felis]
MTSSTTAAFAYDMAILASNENFTLASNFLQNHLNKIATWTKKWRIKINDTKSTHITFTLNKSNCQAVYINKRKIPIKDTVNLCESYYLGIHIDRRLTWKPLIVAKIKQIELTLSKLKLARWSKIKIIIRYVRTIYIRGLTTDGVTSYASNSIVSPLVGPAYVAPDDTTICPLDIPTPCCRGRAFSKCKKSEYELQAANGTPIRTYGLKNLRLNFGLRRQFDWKFIIADVDTPIVGSDFLAFFELLPDCRNRRLVDGKTGLHTACIQFLGYEISATGTKPPSERIENLTNFTRRETAKSASNQAILHDAISSIKGNKSISWTPELEKAFQSCKDKLTEATLLQHPIHGAKLGLFTDASQQAVGACLQQLVENKWPSILLYKVHSSSIDMASLFQRIASGISCCAALQFTTDIKYIGGQENIIADTLSRVEAITKDNLLNFEILAQHQKDDAELKRLLMQDTKLQLEEIPVPGTHIKLFCDTAKAQPRSYIPAPLRGQIFNLLHGLSHPGIRATSRLITARYVWPSIQKNCHDWAKACQDCQKSKITRHVHAPNETFPLSTAKFAHPLIDLPNGQKYTHYWAISAEEIAIGFLSCWISRFGTPVKITTDRGTLFESELFRSLNNMTGTIRIKTCSYHSCSNGLIERFHQQLKAAIMCYKDNTWLEALPLILLGIRNAYKPDIKTSAAEMVYGEPLRLPGEIFELHRNPQNLRHPADLISRLRQHVAHLQPSKSSNHTNNKPFIFQDLQTCTHIFLRDDTIRKSLQQPYQGPYEVLKRDDKTVTIRTQKGNTRVSIDRIKSAYIIADPVG